MSSNGMDAVENILTKILVDSGCQFDSVKDLFKSVRKVIEAKNNRLEAENERLSKHVCSMCHGYGIVGNILDAQDCPDCLHVNAHEDAIAEHHERMKAENEQLKKLLFNEFYQQAGIRGATSAQAEEYANNRMSELIG